MPTPADGYTADLTPTEAWEMLQDGARLVDVRTTAEWGYVGGPDLSSLGQQAVQIEWVTFPSGQLNAEFLPALNHQVPDDVPTLFLCRSGVRSVSAAKAATAAGRAASYNILEGFEGGLDEHGHRGATGWRAAGLPWRQS